MENEHELSYETLKRVYLGSYEHYKGVVAEVEHSKPGFELQGAKMVEMGRSYGSKGLLPYGFERGDGGLGMKVYKLYLQGCGWSKFIGLKCWLGSLAAAADKEEKRLMWPLS
ncbi:hypothetical protein Tco_0801555 [Tanacetum coccineum]|uniref:Uncharacterized protein n=1 Tax=Tanacetum coccineum TaxID=301880 RepID=A0ABQ5A0G4_9ASTR